MQQVQQPGRAWAHIFVGLGMGWDGHVGGSFKIKICFFDNFSEENVRLRVKTGQFYCCASFRQLAKLKFANGLFNV